MFICKVADNVISPLGRDTKQNYDAIKSGQSGLDFIQNKWNLPESFVASLFSEAQREALLIDGCSFFESLVIDSVRQTIEQYPIDLGSDRFVLVIGTTKADIECLNKNAMETMPSPGDAALKIASLLGVKTCPITVCNACISGVSAISIASRLLALQLYDYAVVCGCDCLTDFTVSGFQSLKAMSPEPCHPFDIERLGLNLGEAVATVLLTARKQVDAMVDRSWKIWSSAVRNDAFHISSPSKTAEGSVRAITKVLACGDKRSVTLVNLHGTATMYNDQMESIAVHRCGLSDTPANGLKGFFGHTMGASGLLETILSLHSLDDDTVLATHGFREIGVSGKMNIDSKNRMLESGNHSLLKIISGFGGCNGAVLLDHRNQEYDAPLQEPVLVETGHVMINDHAVVVNGRSLGTDSCGKELLTKLYHQYVNDYPKFYKMDMLSRLGFIASEILIQSEGKERFLDNEHRGIILFNHSSSIVSDKEFEASIKDREQFYPSPSVFVYTLPNIVAGEIAIRNHYMGETSFYVLPEKNEVTISQIIKASFVDSGLSSVLCGWLDCVDEEHFEVDFKLIEIIKN